MKLRDFSAMLSQYTWHIPLSLSLLHPYTVSLHKGAQTEKFKQGFFTEERAAYKCGKETSKGDSLSGAQESGLVLLTAWKQGYLGLSISIPTSTILRNKKCPRRKKYLHDATMNFSQPKL